MKIKFWGVRGSIPTPPSPLEYEEKIRKIILRYNDYLFSIIKDGKEVKDLFRNGPEKVEDFLKHTPSSLKSTYGGNTSSVEIRTNSGQIILLDAGSGIRRCGLSMMRGEFDRGQGKAIVLISHTHFDHIDGWPFFIPAYIRGNEFEIYGPTHIEDGKTLQNVFEEHMNYSYFPINLKQLGATVNFHDMGAGIISRDKVKIYSHPLNHTCMDLGYRIKEGKKVITYQTDSEPYYNSLTDNSEEEINKLVEQKNQDIIEHARGSDVLICDAQYTPEEYPTKMGWGHSTYEQVLDKAKQAEAKKLVLFHFEPTHSDEKLEDNLARAREYAQKINFKGELLLAQEEMELEV